MDLVLRVVGAALFAFLSSQSAEFTQQYLQWLGGTSDALQAVVERFDTSAAAAGLSRPEAVERLKAGPDAFVSRQGVNAADTIIRYEDVSRRYRDLSGSAPLFRPFVAAADLDGEMLSAAAGEYRPAIPTTPDGLALTLAGLGGGWALGAGAAAGVRQRRKARRTSRDTARMGAPRTAR